MNDVWELTKCMFHNLQGQRHDLDQAVINILWQAFGSLSTAMILTEDHGEVTRRGRTAVPSGAQLNTVGNLSRKQKDAIPICHLYKKSVIPFQR